ncbi:MAG: cytochrome c biogenesis protein CcsA [Gemmatimonadetes bacterium]|nr:cytochrome c biogenesis protein CcsA [Gemmatimonadota bacterium]
MMVTILLAIALVLYLGASGTLAASFAGGRATVPRLGAALTGGALAFHAAALAVFTVLHAELPLVGLAPSLSTLAFLITLFFFATTLARESRPVGLVLVPLTSLLLAIALIVGMSPSGEPLAFSGVWFSFHVLLAFIGYAGLTVAFAAGLLYLLQFRELKGKRLGRVFRFFPSLPALDTIGRLGLLVGFPALSAALLLGWAWTVRFRNTFAVSEPEVIWGVLTWLIYAIVLAIRFMNKPNTERRAAFVTVIGFAFVVASYLLLRLFIPGGAFL